MGGAAYGSIGAAACSWDSWKELSSSYARECEYCGGKRIEKNGGYGCGATVFKFKKRTSESETNDSPRKPG